MTTTEDQLIELQHKCDKMLDTIREFVTAEVQSGKRTTIPGSGACKQLKRWTTAWANLCELADNNRSMETKAK